MTDFDLALKKPFTSFKVLIIGILLSILPIIRWFAYGFILECSKIGKNRSDDIPEWKNWKELFVKGFLATVIEAIYYLPSFLILLIFGLGLMNFLLKEGIATEIFNNFISRASPESLQLIMQKQIPFIMPYLVKMVPVLIIAGILLIIAAYIVPMAILNYLKNNRFSAAFEKDVFRKAFTGKFFLIRIIAGILTLIVASILAYVPIIGYAISFFIMGVFSYTLFGQAYLELEAPKEIKKEKRIKKLKR